MRDNMSGTGYRRGEYSGIMVGCPPCPTVFPIKAYLDNEECPVCGLEVAVMVWDILEELLDDDVDGTDESNADS